MKQFIVLLLIGMLASVTIFAFTGSHAMHCLELLTGGQAIPCPEHGVFAFLSKSAQAFQNISVAYLVSILSVLFAMLILVLYELENLRPRSEYAFQFQAASPVGSYHKHIFSSWFSLHENSPSAI